MDSHSIELAWRGMAVLTIDPYGQGASSASRGERMACHGIQPRKGGGKMRTGRPEAFSDGVIAIIITIMVLEMTEGIFVVAALIWLIPDRRIESSCQ